MALNGEQTAVTEFRPQNNTQAYLAYLNGFEGELPEPRSIEEVLLYNLCVKGIGGGGSAGTDAVVYTARDADGHPTAVDASGLTVLHTSQFYSGRADCPCAKVKTFKLPTGITEMPDYVFAYCAGMESMSIPNGVTRIGESAFIGCTSLKSIVIPGTVKEIDKKAFYDCSSLESLVINEGVKVIDSQAFQGCDALASLTIPASVTTVESQFVRDCAVMKSVVFKGKPTSISTLAFMGANALADIYVPWAEGEVAGAPWNATAATIHYNQ